MVVYESSAKDARGLTSCHLGHSLGPGNTGQAGVVPEVRESTHLHLDLIFFKEADVVVALTRAKSASLLHAV